VLGGGEITIGYDAMSIEKCFIVERIISRTTEPFYKVINVNELKNIDLVIKEKGTMPFDWLCGMYLDKQPDSKL
jgi:hypothetical protein